MSLFVSPPLKSYIAGVSRLAIAAALAAALGACAKRGPELTGSIKAPETQLSDAEARQQTESLAARYRSKPEDPETAIAYARSLRAGGQRAQAAAVLQQTSIRNPRNMAVLGAYGRALADAGRLEEALGILAKAHTPDQPNWRVLNAQGVVLDQMGKHGDAQRYYDTALRIAPGEPAILSNLGLSYALSKELERAEDTLRKAAADSRADPKVRQNLGVVLALRAKFEEAERVTTGLLPPDQARSNVAYVREMMQASTPPQPQKKGAPAHPKVAASG
jgi:Flp pilus assembly protein TadD